MNESQQNINWIISILLHTLISIPQHNQVRARLNVPLCRCTTHTHTHTQSSRQCTDLLWVQFVCAALVLVDHVAGRQPVHRGVENGHHHPAGEPLLLPQTVQVTVAHLGMGRPQSMSQQHLTAFSSRVLNQPCTCAKQMQRWSKTNWFFLWTAKVSLVYFYDLLFTTVSGKNRMPPLNVVIVSLAAIKCLKTVDFVHNWHFTHDALLSSE